MSTWSSFFEKGILLIKPLKASQSWHPLSFYENRILVQKCILNEWVLRKTLKKFWTWQIFSRVPWHMCMWQLPGMVKVGQTSTRVMYISAAAQSVNYIFLKRYWILIVIKTTLKWLFSPFFDVQFQKKSPHREHHIQIWWW